MDKLVECRSDNEYAGRPLALYWQGERLEVDEIRASWLTPEGKCFRVVARNGLPFELCYSQAEDAWRIVQR